MSGNSDSGKHLGQKSTPRVARYCRQDQVSAKKKQIAEKPKNPTSGDGVFKTPTPLRRCSSLISMSPSRKNNAEVQQRVEELNCSLKLPNEDEKDVAQRRDNELSWRVLYSFTKNVAQKRKLEIDQLSQDIEKSNETTSKLNIQVSLLKNIIKSDEVKREAWKKRLQEDKIVLESTARENERLQMELNTLAEILEKMKDTISYLETENNNYKNTQIFLTSECHSFEQQLKKERDSLNLVKYENQLEVKKLRNILEKKETDNGILQNEINKLESLIATKTFQLSESEVNLENNQRLLQNASKEILQLNKESHGLRKENNLLQNEIITMKNTMTLLEDNQEQIYKYFNLNIES